eukprot:m.32443 g.32443  ORF g.32443 m.32443 type:complete len:50 (+) comp14115_c0_seq5:400-549(+)
MPTVPQFHLTDVFLASIERSEERKFLSTFCGLLSIDSHTVLMVHINLPH